MTLKRFFVISAFPLLLGIGAPCAAQQVDANAKARVVAAKPNVGRSLSGAAAAQDLSRYEGREIASVEVAVDGFPRNAEFENELTGLIRIAANGQYRAAEVRESLVSLWESKTVSNARVEVTETNETSPVRVRFLVRPQARVADVEIDLEAAPGSDINEDQLRARLDLLEPGARATETILKQNADAIQTYLRERGFYQAGVDATQQINEQGTRSTITYRVRTGAQARVSSFNINITGFDAANINDDLRLQPGEEFSNRRLEQDLERIRARLIRQNYLAPQLQDAQVSYDNARNTIAINLTGNVGARVEVKVNNYEIGDDDARALLPVRREGSIDYSLIVEGERRLLNRLQEDGYFFAEVETACRVTPALSSEGLPVAPQGAARRETGCELLNAEELTNRNLVINYNVEPNRRLRLTDIRIEGTDKLITETEDIRTQLQTKEATALGFIPFLGYRRGYTNEEALEADRQIIRQRMRELGFRRADVEVRQGVSLDGENLVVTFAVNENALTRIVGGEVRGNQIYSEAQIRSELRNTTPGEPYSRLKAQQDGERILQLYARNGYIDTDVRLDIVELPRESASGDERVRVIYNVIEGEKVFVGRIFVNGNERTKRDAVVRALNIKEGDVLRADRLADSERALYATDAFRQVTIRTEPAGETASGFRKRDILIDIEERAPRVLDYGGGYSTDTGALGLFELRSTNLFGRLRQGALRIRASQRRQLLQLEYVDPRFSRYRSDKFSPLVVSAQYSRDTNVTRFFRSTIDRGSGGIVQALDEEGNPFDFIRGEVTGVPAINRAAFNIETRRNFEPVRDENGNLIKEKSTLFVRYNYEDVRLFNTESLLLRDLLEADRVTRLSRFAATFARDTRDNQTDATRGQFFTLDYNVSLRQLGANISFNKFQTRYNIYRQLSRNSENRFLQTVLTGSFSLGVANVISPRDRDRRNGIDDADRRLPISERFFAGGSTTLRGFAFEEAGPRFIFRGGEFRNREGELTQVNPFTVPFGGNGLLVVNLEARIPVTRRFQLVPFYDGGNIYERASDIFRKPQDDDDPRDPNLRSRYTNTVGLGLRLRTPFGALAVDYGYLLNPPEFILPNGVDRIKLRTGQLHFRFGQAF